MLHKRKIFLRLTVLILIALFLFGCTSPVPNKSSRKIFDGFSVHYLDVGEGDAIFIHFPDGKNMLIDSGEKDEDLSKFIIGFLDDYGVEKIDYFVLTHPDSDHTGNAVDIIDEFEIGTAYLPDMRIHINLYESYSKVYNKINEKQITVEYSDCFDHIIGQNYVVAFLSPNALGTTNSSYTDFNATQSPSATQSNAMSPIIYIEYSGVRFIFTGDAPISQETVALNNVKVFSEYYAELGVNLENIDFLKVSHHGSNDASGNDFLSVLKPKNAIISVGGDNIYGHPNVDVLARLFNANQNYNLYRTDVHGTISVEVDKNGNTKIITDKSIN
ncbi:MAG: MBL fold metallo-hydrolase [Clostridia bacterium]|nr:MBL fold metallo-hydrolase [Clostridia bacterium]